jgi:hypothetical protein
LANCFLWSDQARAGSSFSAGTIKRDILKSGIEIVFQKPSGNYLYITELKPT